MTQHTAFRKAFLQILAMNLSAGWILLGLVASDIAGANIERQHQAHVHGEATGTLAIDGQTLTLQLEFPGFNLVGFEHPPRNPDQRQALESTLDRLNRGAWLAIDQDLLCPPANISVTPHGFGDEAEHHDDAGHQHSESHDHEGHARFEIQAITECAKPLTSGAIDLADFWEFPNNETLVVDVLTETAIFQAELSAGQPTLRWP